MINQKLMLLLFSMFPFEPRARAYGSSIFQAASIFSGTVFP